MQIHASMKMAEVIHINYHLLPIILRFGINLGFGDKTVYQVCKECNINSEFFLEIINSYHLKDYFPKKHLQGFSLDIIVDYLRKSHNYYVHTKIPQVASLLNQLSAVQQTVSNQPLLLIDQFFQGYKNELYAHIKREEDKVYPYVFAVESAFLQKKSDRIIIEKIKTYSIDDFENEHDNVEDKLLDLKNIMIKYLPQPMDINLTQSIIFELFRLETDLRDHARIEDKILVPKVKYMEKWILEHYMQ